MKKLIKSIHSLSEHHSLVRYVVLSFLLLFLSVTAYSQIGGLTTVNAGQSYVYTYTYTAGVTPQWGAINGTVTNPVASGTSYSATVTWNAVGSGTVSFSVAGGLLAQLNVAIGVAPPVAVSGHTCGTGTVALSATPGQGGSVIRWYVDTGRNTVYFYQGNSYTTPTLSASVTYYISTYNTTTSAESTPRVPITATVYPTVSNPVVAATSRCGPGAVTLTGTPGTNGSTLRWYAAASGGTHLSEGTTYSPTVTTTTTLYVSSFDGCMCESARIPVSITVNALPLIPATPNVVLCGGGSTTLTGTPGSGGNSLRWYNSASATTPLATGTSYTTTVTSTTTFYVATLQTTTQCESASRSTLQVTVSSAPAPPVAGPYAGRFGVGDVTLQASGGTLYQWYDNSMVLLPGETGPSLTRAFTANTTYKVKKVDPVSLCQSTAISVTGYLFAFPKITAPGSTFIVAGQSYPLLTATGGTYTTWQWKKNGVAIASATASTYQPTSPGSYTVEVSLANNLKTETSSYQLRVLENKPEAFTPVYDNNTPAAAVANGRKNYVRTFTPRLEVSTVADVTLATVNADKVTVETAFLDGLGVGVQQVSYRSSPGNADVVVHQEYDVFGRQVKEYLPYTTLATTDADGYRLDARLQQYQFYRNGTPNVPVTGVPYAEKSYEPSPANRMLKQASPGESWKTGSGHEVRTDSWSFYPDIDGDIISWTVNSSDQLVQGGVYTANMLQVSSVRDENNTETRTYTDTEGRTVLKRVQDEAGAWASTYYVYDQFNNLRFVLPPQLVNTLPASFVWATHATTYIDPLAFQYKYDARQRMIEKRVPGAGWVYMIYDKLDRLVISQDARQRIYSMWTFTKYDTLGRPVLTGLYKTRAGETYSGLRTTISGQVTCETRKGSVDYSLGRTFPKINESLGDTILSQSYYDNYVLPSFFNTWRKFTLENSITVDSGRVTGLLTAAKVRNLEGLSWLGSVTYYDARGRTIQTVQQNHLGGKDRVSLRYIGLTGALESSVSSHILPTRTIAIKRGFTYDRAMRVMTSTHKIDALPEVTLASTTYNETSQPIAKNLHGPSTWKQTVNYAYNIRGFLTSINDAALSDPTDYFGMELFYDNGYAQKNYNGNISGSMWGQGFQNKKLSYGYVYDNMNRLKLGDYRQADSGGQWTLASGIYNEYIKDYDANGNIKSLVRNGVTAGTQTFGVMDDLTYTYSGNQLLKVADAASLTAGFADGNISGNDYTYDVNGNMVTDLNKSIPTNGISYNDFNLVRKVRKSSGEKVLYTYDGSGRKLRQSVYNAAGTLVKKSDYAGDFFYENDTLKFISHEEGRVVPDAAAWEYQYMLKDHLGNVRVTFTAKTQATSTYTTNFEAATNSDFLNYSSQTFDLVDHTDAAGTVYQKTQKLNGGVNGRVGIAKSFTVMPGDQINLSAYVKYMNLGSTPNPNVLINSLASAFGVSSSSTGEQLKAYNGLNSYAGTVAAGDHTGDDEGAPKAFITVLFFDKDYNFIDAAWDQVSTVGAQTSATVKQPPHDLLSVSVKAKQAGYAYVFCSNEHPNYVDVYFDDVTLGYTPSAIVGVNDYYSFGLAFNSYNRENSVTNNYTYNSKEKQDELDLGWLDFGRRMYDPACACFHTQDRFADKFHSLSPYQFAANNPVANKDVNGDFIVSIHYQMTYDILKKYGYSEEAADAGSYYSSYYADRPPGLVTRGNNFIAKSWGMASVGDRPGWNDNETMNSQDTSSPVESQRHSMEGDHENIGSLAAKKRGQEFGWSKVFEAAKAGDPSTFKKGSKAAKAFGVGVHALQDSKAHEGVKMDKHDINKDMGQGEDGLNAYKNGMNITESAVLVVQMLNGNYSNIKDGTTIEISGMNSKQLNQLIDAALKSEKKVRFQNEYKDH